MDQVTVVAIPDVQYFVLMVRCIPNNFGQLNRGILPSRHFEHSVDGVHGELLFRRQQADEIVRGNEIATENC